MKEGYHHPLELLPGTSVTQARLTKHPTTPLDWFTWPVRYSDDGLLAKSCCSPNQTRSWISVHNLRAKQSHQWLNTKQSRVLNQSCAGKAWCVNAVAAWFGQWEFGEKSPIHSPLSVTTLFSRRFMSQTQIKAQWYVSPHEILKVKFPECAV